jgi:hypothetical protein
VLHRPPITGTCSKPVRAGARRAEASSPESTRGGNVPWTAGKGDRGADLNEPIPPVVATGVVQCRLKRSR